MSQDVYCADSSSLMEMPRRYPVRRFPGVWQKMGELVEADQLIAPREVLREIVRGDDELVAWAKRHKKKLFMPPDDCQTQVASEVLREFPSLIDPLSEAPQADPFVIALARCGNEAHTGSLFKTKHVVVSQESRSNPDKIPQVCARFGIECICLLELFERERWKF